MKPFPDLDFGEKYSYPFGLRIDGISSRKLDIGLEGSLKNNNLYNDKELWDDADLDWYDYGFRNYDPQIGRFTQLDPLTDDYPELTPYQYASDEPIANVDMDGLEKIGSTVASAVGGAIVTEQSFLQEVVVMGLSHTVKSSGSLLSAAGHFFKGFGKDLWGAVKGVAHAAVHLDKTVISLVKLNTTEGQINMGLAAYNKGKEVQQQWKNGSLNDKAEIVGAGVGEIVQLFGREVSEVGKVGEISKVAEVSEDVGRVAEAGELAERRVFTVTKEGVVLPKGAKIPKNFIENKYRSSNYGVMENGKYVEKVRIDPGTPSGFKGPNEGHFHLNDGDHIFDASKWLWWN